MHGGGKLLKTFCTAIDGLRITPPARVEGTLHAMHLFVVECGERDTLQKFLETEKIGTAIHYPKAIHQQPAYKGRIRVQ